MEDDEVLNPKLIAEISIGVAGGVLAAKLIIQLLKALGSSN